MIFVRKLSKQCYDPNKLRCIQGKIKRPEFRDRVFLVEANWFCTLDLDINDSRLYTRIGDGSTAQQMWEDL